jgi:hypothetical protein
MDHGKARGELRSLLDKQIMDLRAQTDRLLQRRNALAPIACLPAEVLAEIFVAARDIVYTWYSDHKRALWEALIHTCQGWRNVAIQCPRLWSVIEFDPHTVPWSLLMMARARSSPLALKVDCLLPKQVEHVMTEVAGRMSVVRELSISLNAPISDMTRVLFTSAAAPILETFEVHYPGGYCGYIAVQDFPLDGIFGGRHDKLKALSVTCTKIFWGSSIFHAASMISLNISVMQDNTSIYPMWDWQGMTEMLVHCSQLEELRISSDISQSGPLPVLKNARMPKLRMLDVSGYLGPLVPALGCLTLSVAVCIRLKVWTSSVTPELGSALWKYYEELTLHGFAPMHTVHFVEREGNDQTAWNMHAWSSEQSENTEFPCTDSAWLSISCPTVSYWRGKFPQDVGRSFKRMLANTQDVLLVPRQAHFIPSSWSTLFSSLPAVETLRMARLIAPCLQALLGDSLNTGRIPLPALKEVLFYDACFYRNELVPWLDARQQLGFGLESVSLVRCTYQWTTAEEQAFRDGVHSSVGQVRWWDLSNSYSAPVES